LIQAVQKCWLGLRELPIAERSQRGKLRKAREGKVMEGHINFEELGAKLRELAADRATAEHELEDLNLRRSRLEDLERDKETLLEDFATMVPGALDELTGEKRHQVYRMLRLQVHVSPEGELDVRGVLREAVCTTMDTLVAPHRNVHSFGLPPSHRGRTDQPRLKLYNAARLASIGARRITQMSDIRNVLGELLPRTP
jgi:hypothetical protein